MRYGRRQERLSPAASRARGWPSRRRRHPPLQHTSCGGAGFRSGTAGLDQFPAVRRSGWVLSHSPTAQAPAVCLPSFGHLARPKPGSGQPCSRPPRHLGTCGRAKSGPAPDAHLPCPPHRAMPNLPKHKRRPGSHPEASLGRDAALALRRDQGPAQPAAPCLHIDSLQQDTQTERGRADRQRDRETQRQSE